MWKSLRNPRSNWSWNTSPLLWLMKEVHFRKTPHHPSHERPPLSRFIAVCHVAWIAILLVNLDSRADRIKTSNWTHFAAYLHSSFLWSIIVHSITLSYIFCNWKLRAMWSYTLAPLQRFRRWIVTMRSSCCLSIHLLEVMSFPFKELWLLEEQGERRYLLIEYYYHIELGQNCSLCANNQYLYTKSILKVSLWSHSL